MIKGSYDESYSKQKARSQYFWVLRQWIYFGFLIGSNTQFSFICLYLLERWLSVNWECHPDLLFGTTCLPDLSHFLTLNKIFCFTIFFPVQLYHPIVSTQFCPLPFPCFPSKYSSLFASYLHLFFTSFILFLLKRGQKYVPVRDCVFVYFCRGGCFVGERGRGSLVQRTTGFLNEIIRITGS